MNSAVYIKLLDEKKAGKLRIISLLAPARSSSTALERAILESPSVDLQVNDPWAIYDDEEREDKSYAYIASRLEEIASKPSKTILIKNVADYIPPGACWKRWCDLVDDHIFLIRNPLLTMHSLFRMLPMKCKSDDIVVGGMTMDIYAKTKGYSTWLELQEAIHNGNTFYDFGDLYFNLFQNDQKIHKEPFMYVPVLQMIGEAAAHDAGYNDWEALKKQIFTVTDYKDYKQFEALLDRAFAFRITGWEALWQHFVHTLNIARPGNITVAESTMFRADPERTLRFLCKRLGIEFVKGMYEWPEQGKHFTTDYDGEVPYYDRVAGASKIEPPTEEVIPPEAFPPFFTHHLMNRGGAFEVYMLMMAKMEKPYFKGFELPDAVRAVDPVFSAAFDSVKKAMG